MIINAKIAFFSFIVSWSICILLSLFNSASFYANYFLIVFLLVHIWLFRKSTGDLKQVTWRAYLLGFLFSVGFFIVFYFPKYLSAGLYIIVLTAFHFGEYVSTALFNPSQLKLEAFILNHSFEYNLALLLSWIEYGILMYFFPESKQITFLIVVGFLGCLIGDGFRKLAMYTAGQNFNHVVQHQRQTDHVLVTSGIYSLVRHPSYTGWFCWSVCTQVLLCNPLCFLAYNFASWKFFNERIEFEELTLINFFGRDYINYQKSVPSGIPFVYGYKI